MAAPLDHVIQNVCTLIERMLLYRDEAGNSYKDTLVKGASVRMTRMDMKAVGSAGMALEWVSIVRQVAMVMNSMASECRDGVVDVAELRQLDPYCGSVPVHVGPDRVLNVGGIAGVLARHTAITLGDYLHSIDRTFCMSCCLSRGDTAMDKFVSWLSESVGSWVARADGSEAIAESLEAALEEEVGRCGAEARASAETDLCALRSMRSCLLQGDVGECYRVYRGLYGPPPELDSGVQTALASLARMHQLGCSDQVRVGKLVRSLEDTISSIAKLSIPSAHQLVNGDHDALVVAVSSSRRASSESIPLPWGGRAR
eukprot:6463292-Prymnesium_polylepis.1